MKKGTKRAAGGTVAAVGILALLLSGRGGLGLGSGMGPGESASVPKEPEAVVEVEEKTEEPVEIKEETEVITIEVSQGTYLVNGEEKTLEEVEALIQQSGEEDSFVAEDNYAAAKAWDELMALFAEYEIAVVEG